MLSFESIHDDSLPIASIHNKKYDNVVYLNTKLDERKNKMPKLGHMDRAYDSDSESEQELDYTSSEEIDDRVDARQFKIISLDRVNQRFSIIPNISGSDRIFISGPSGSGKSTIIRQYITDFLKLFPDKKVYLFSDVDKDEVLDDISEITRMPLDESFLENTPHPEEIRDSLVIFDDIDSVQSKKILSAVQTLRDSILRRGRHEEILHVITTSHLLTDYKNTRVPLSEATHIIVFPGSGASSGLTYLLKNYVGLGTKQIPLFKKLKSRWVCVRISYPQIIITENQCFLLSELENI